MRAVFQIKYWFVVFGGACVSILVWKIMELQFRHGVAIVGGILCISAGLVLIKRIEDFLIYTIIFNAPFDRFGKWLAPHTDVWVVAPGIAFGLAEVLIFAAYTVWFAQIFIAKKEPIPKFQNLDYFIVLLVISQFISLIPAPHKIIGFYDIVYTMKHILIYFFIVNKVKRRHLKWIVLILLSAILVESALAGYERFTGNVGIGNAKGDTENVRFGDQYEILGTEKGTIRAEGTTSDAHTLGLYFAMLLPVPLVFSLMQYLRPHQRLVMLFFLIAGTMALVFTYTRAGWLCFAISSAFVLWVIIFSWKAGRTFIYVMVVIIAVSVAYPELYTKIYDRFASSPSDLVSERIGMIKTALNIWGNNFLLGCGNANYMYCLQDPDVIRYDYRLSFGNELPVHFLPLFFAAEIGIFGVIAYYAVIFIAMTRCFKQLKCKDLLIRGLALAILAGFISYLLDGFSSPMGRELIPMYTLWIYIALSVAFKRILQEQNDKLEPAVNK